MRKDLLALGLILLFVGMASMSISQVTVTPEPIQSWVTVAESTSQEPSNNMTVQGTLTQGDRFRVYFLYGPYSGAINIDAGVLINLTDPTGYTKSFYSLVESGPSYPEYTANSTGTYRANALAILISITSLTFEKMEIEEKGSQHPYSIYLPVGGVIFAGGSGILLLGRKISKRRRRVGARFRKYKR